MLYDLFIFFFFSLIKVLEFSKKYFKVYHRLLMDKSGIIGSKF